MEEIKIDGTTFEVSKCSNPYGFGYIREGETIFSKIINVTCDRNSVLFHSTHPDKAYTLDAKGKQYRVCLKDKDECDLTLSFKILS